MAQRVVLRLGRRRSAWEQADPAAIAKVEFRDQSKDALDHRPSVYVLSDTKGGADRAAAVRARCEHSASFMSPPPGQGSLEFDLEGATPASIQPSLGTTQFTFANERHAEVMLTSDAEVVALVQRLLEERSSRAVALAKEEILSYIAERLDQGDPEWTAIARTSRYQEQGWDEALRKWRAKRPA